jgi:Ulp1 family protease
MSDNVLFTYHCTPHGIDVRKRDVDRIKQNSYLNDTVVDMFSHLIARDFPAWKTYSCFIITELKHGVPINKLKNKFKLNPFAYDYLFFPVNNSEEKHWYGIIVILKHHRCILYVDSLSTPAKHLDDTVSTLRKWLNMEFAILVEKNVNNTFDQWTLPLYDVQVPKQRDGVNCGVYMLRTLERAIETRPKTGEELIRALRTFSFSPQEATLFRDRMGTICMQLEIQDTEYQTIRRRVLEVVDH